MSDEKSPMYKNSTLTNASRVNCKELLTAIKDLRHTRHPILIRGRHGIGKSEIVAQFAKKIGFKLVDRRASQMSDGGDLTGVPQITNGMTKYFPPDWLWTACNEPSVLFLDELDRASNDVRQGFFELCDSRKIFGNVLHPETLIFAAINGGSSDTQYQVYEFDPAELSRWTVFDFRPEKEEWLDWATEPNESGNPNILPAITSFLRNHIAYLEFDGETMPPNKVLPCRRSWARFSQALSSEGISLSDVGRIAVLGQAIVGHEPTIGFIEYLRTDAARLTPKDIIYDGRGAEAKDFELVDHLKIFEMFNSNREILDDLTKKQVTNLWTYVMLLPSEIFMKMDKFLQTSPELRIKISDFKDGAYNLKYKKCLNYEHIPNTLEAFKNTPEMVKILEQIKQQSEKNENDNKA